MPGSLQNILIIFILSIHGLQLTIQRVASIAQGHFKTDRFVSEPVNNIVISGDGDTTHLSNILYYCVCTGILNKEEKDKCSLHIK